MRGAVVVVAVVLLAAAGGVSAALSSDAPARADQVTEPALRAELVQMMRVDQEERTGTGLPPGTRLGPTRDYSRSSRLKAIVAERGWPTTAMVGPDGGTAAWLIAQHSDFDVAFQQQAAALMRPAVEAGQADPGQYAYLQDRIAVNRQQPQAYGSQIRCRDGVPAPATPLIDPPRVDERRASVGLDPLATYYQELATMCAQEEAEGQQPAP